VECAQAVDLMTDYLENALSGRERRRFERHLTSCLACMRHLSQMKALIAAAGRLRAEDLPEDVVDELIALYRRVRAS
jgi:anti-sigma factor RsiW